MLVPPLFRSRQRNSDSSASKKLVDDFPTESDISQRSPGNDEPNVRQSSKDASGLYQQVVEGRSKNSPRESPHNVVVSGQSSQPALGSSSGQRLEDDIARLYMNTSAVDDNDDDDDDNDDDDDDDDGGSDYDDDNNDDDDDDDDDDGGDDDDDDGSDYDDDDDDNDDDDDDDDGGDDDDDDDDVLLLLLLLLLL